MTDQKTSPRLHVTPKGRVYKIDGVKVPSVTTILGALPKALTQWAADTAAKEAVNNWDELSELDVTDRFERIRYAHNNVRRAAALRGTEIHDLGEKVAKGEKVVVPDQFRGPVEAYARFVDRYDVEPVASEVPVASITHGYAGRSDLWAWITTRTHGRVYAMVDLKSGGKIYEDVVLQLHGYACAEVWQPDGPKSEAPLPPPQILFVAHIMPDDIRLIPVELRPEIDFRQFLYVKQTWQWLDAHGWKGDEPLLGEAELPPIQEDTQA